MQAREMMKQVIELNQNVFNYAFNNIVSTQDLFGQISITGLNKASWLPEEGRKCIENWYEFYKTSRATFKKQMDESYKKAEEFCLSHAPANSDAGTISILLADDHQLMREALAKLLQGRKELTIVGQAIDGREAVQLAAKLKPDVILMDVTMPELDGFEATAQVTSNNPDIRIIGLSLHNDENTRQKMFNAGASAYLTKTVSPDVLIGTILRMYHGNE